MKPRSFRAALIAGGAVLVVALVGMVAQNYYTVQELKQARVAQEDRLIKAEVDSAASMLQAMYGKYQRGEMSLTIAKIQGADILRKMRYEGNGYFFADTTEGVNVVLLGDKKVEGKNRLDAQVNGVSYVKEIIKNGMTGNGGYTDYFFPKMGETEPKAKRSYSTLVKPFGWVIGTGYYMEDLK
ncbi:MAG: cache domain-containing protein [Patescibacteria group bacterium]